MSLKLVMFLRKYISFLMISISEEFLCSFWGFYNRITKMTSSQILCLPKSLYLLPRIFSILTLTSIPSISHEQMGIMSFFLRRTVHVHKVRVEKKGNFKLTEISYILSFQTHLWPVFFFFFFTF